MSRRSNNYQIDNYQNDYDRYSRSNYGYSQPSDTRYFNSYNRDNGYGRNNGYDSYDRYGRYGVYGAVGSYGNFDSNNYGSYGRNNYDNYGGYNTDNYGGYNSSGRDYNNYNRGYPSYRY